MIKLIWSILVEAVLGLAAAGVVLAVAIPLMIRHQLAGPGDAAMFVVVLAVIVCAVGAMVFRPRSALRRHGKS